MKSPILLALVVGSIGADSTCCPACPNGPCTDCHPTEGHCCPCTGGAGSGNYTATPARGFAQRGSARVHNRPLYGPGTSLIVLAGDRPLLRFADDRVLYGTVLVGLALLPPPPPTSAPTPTSLAAPTPAPRGFWAHEASNVSSEYTAGAMRWRVSDDALLPGATLTMLAVPAAVGKGLLVDVNVSWSAAAATTAAAA